MIKIIVYEQLNYQFTLSLLQDFFFQPILTEGWNSDWQLVYMDAIINWNIPLHTDWVVVAFWEYFSFVTSLKWELLLIWMLVSKDNSRSMILTNISVRLTIHFSVDGHDLWSLILLLVTSRSLEESYSRENNASEGSSVSYIEKHLFLTVSRWILNSFFG